MTLKELVARKKDLMRLKKATMKQCEPFTTSSNLSIIGKAQNKNEDNESELFRTIVGNTYNWMDSDDDVLIEGVFSKSLKENGNNILHLHDHIHQLTARVGTPLKVYEQEVEYKEVGFKDFEGKTTALLMDSRIEKSRNASIFEDYKSGIINQHSVGMRYVKLDLAVNDKDSKEEYAVWNKYFDRIINQEQAEKKGYFWAVQEGQLIEISCVIKGSNILTPTLPTKSIEQVIDELKSSYSKNDLTLLSKALQEQEPQTALTTEKPQFRELLIQNLK